MKAVKLILLMLVSCAVCAQNSTFIRVYDRSGQKINSGVLLVVSDTTLQLKVTLNGKVTTKTIPFHEIGYIITKRSNGHNVFMGSVIGMSIMVIVGAGDEKKGIQVTQVPIGAYAITGLSMGAMLGVISILFKGSKTYLVNGDPVSWNKFKISVHQKGGK